MRTFNVKVVNANIWEHVCHYHISVLYKVQVFDKTDLNRTVSTSTSRDWQLFMIA